ncbi:MAG: sugar phosphate isomerase/epimerase, partial [Clostridia bacterium]|nr:sugar phosphate isomerase/epimerase [Clostridia bacterium]
MVKLGCCIPGGSFMPEGVAEVPQSAAEQLAAKCRYVLECGFDYTECGGMMPAGLSEEELDWLEAEDKKNPLGLLAVNSIFSPQYKLADPDDNWDAIAAYVKRLIDVLSRFGIRYAVFGSGAARSIPDTVDEATGYANLRRLMNTFADYGEQKGVTLVIEPLR